MEVVILGLPLSGKTTLFKALTRGATGTRDGVPVGVTKVADARLDRLAEMFQPKKVTPAEVTYYDPQPPREPGKSRAVGGALMNLLQRADVVLVVVRAFDDPSVPAPEGGVDAHRDVAVMQGELALSDLVILEKRIERIRADLKGAKAHERDLALREQALLERVRGELDQGVPIRRQALKDEERSLLANYQLLTAKPLLLVFNVGEDVLPRALQTEAELASRYDALGVKALVTCARLEAELSELGPDEEREFRQSMGATDVGVGRIAVAAQRLLGLVPFFTVKGEEVRAWMVQAGLPAAQAAGKIHADMERGFIRAEVVSFDDLMACGSMAEARRRGLLRLEGKSYPVQDGDILTILFST